MTICSICKTGSVYTFMTKNNTATEEVYEAHTHLERAVEEFDEEEHGERGETIIDILTDLQEISLDTAISMEEVSGEEDG